MQLDALNRVHLRRLAGALMLALWLAGCATAPPVQEMSDARQAIAAAQEAGAGEFAAGPLADAVAALDAAEDFLRDGTSAGYWQAKKAALSAKELAFDALLKSRTARDQSD